MAGLMSAEVDRAENEPRRPTSVARPAPAWLSSGRQVPGQCKNTGTSTKPLTPRLYRNRVYTPQAIKLRATLNPVLGQTLHASSRTPQPASASDGARLQAAKGTPERGTPEKSRLVRPNLMVQVEEPARLEVRGSAPRDQSQKTVGAVTRPALTSSWAGNQMLYVAGPTIMPLFPKLQVTKLLGPLSPGGSQHSAAGGSSWQGLGPAAIAPRSAAAPLNGGAVTTARAPTCTGQPSARLPLQRSSGSDGRDSWQSATGEAPAGNGQPTGRFSLRRSSGSDGRDSWQPTIGEATDGGSNAGEPEGRAAVAAPGGPEPAADRTSPVDPVDPLAVTRMGVTLRGLRKIRASLEQLFGDALRDMSTAEVNQRWVEEVTAARRCRLLELEHIAVPADVAPPMYFVSHAWKNRVLLLLDFVLDGFLAAAGDSVSVWLDILAVNQHEDTQAHSYDIAAFEHVIRACTAGTIVVMDVANCNPSSRGWCMFEWAHTLAAHGPDGLHMRLEPEDRAAVFSSLDIRRAECQFPRDKEMILAAVHEQHGSADTFNAKLKLQLLLEPLSYSVDLRRLIQRAQGTAWAFGAVREWLGAGPAAGSRVLCVSAGAGEGKSTISAVLCEGAERGDLGEGVTAYHFLKYNDQRRLDPLRVIKSLAFQLASRLPAVCQALLSLDVAEVAQMKDVDEAFARLLLEPLEALQQTAQPQGHDTQQQQLQQVVLLIDALDEADPLAQQLASRSSKSACPSACGNRILQLITTCLASLPPFVRFIFTTRPDAAAGQVLPGLERAFAASVTRCYPSDLRACVGGAAGGGGGGGVMVYHTAAAAVNDDPAAAAAGPQAAPVAAALQEPQLDDVYRLYGKVFESAQRRLLTGGGVGGARVVADLLAVLMAAREPLSQSFLQQLGGLGDGIPLLPGYPTLFFLDEHHLYTVHKSLGDWLHEPLRSGAFAVDVSRGHERIGLHLAANWRQTSGSMPYTLKYVVPHLAAAAGTGSRPSAPAAAALDALLSDFGFIRAVLQAGAAPGVIGALGDMSTHTGCSYDALRWLRSEQYNLEGKAEGELARDAALWSTPVNTKLYDTAVRASGLAWRTRLMLPASAGDWPAVQAVLKGHTQKVCCVAFSPDGRQVVSSSSDQALRTWDTATGRCTATLRGHTADAYSVAFSPDGRQIVSGGGDCVVRVWDVATGQSTAALQGHTDRVRSVAFSPDGSLVLSCSWDRTVRVWDAAAGLCIATLEGHTERVRGAAFSPDGRRVVSGSDDNTVRIWDTVTWEPSATLQGHEGTVRGVAFSPDGRRVASGSDDCTVRVWDVGTGQCAAALQGHKSRVTGVAFSPDGSLVASSSDDRAVRIWDAASGQCTATLRGHVSTVCTVAFSPDGGLLSSGGEDQVIRIWDVAAAQCAATLHGDKNWVYSVAFSPDGRQVVSGSDDCEVHVWDSARGQCVSSLQGHTGDIYGTCYSADGKRVASVSADAMARVWDVARERCIATMVGHTDRVNGVAFSPDGRQMVTGGGDRTVRIWDAASGQCTATLGGHTLTVYSVAFSPDGMQVASGGSDMTVRVWDAASAQCVAALEGHTSRVSSVVFSRDGRLMASGSDDRTARIWDRATGKCTATLQGHTHWVFSVAFSPDGRQLASGSSDQTVRLWDLPSGRCIALLEGHTHWVNAVAFSPDGRHVASGSTDQTVRIWAPAVGQATTPAPREQRTSANSDVGNAHAVVPMNAKHAMKGGGDRRQHLSAVLQKQQH